MGKLKRAMGFCSTCMSNVPHALRQNLIWQFVNLCLLRAPQVVLRIGPWHCVQCGQKRLFLPLHDLSAPDYRDSLDVQQNDRPRNSRQLVIEPNEWIPGGNFIKEEKDILQRSKSLKRFSEKYRDAIVMRLVCGTTTLAKVRSDLGTSEAELMHWIHDKINRLTRENEFIRSQLGIEISEPERLDDVLGEFFDASTTVQGNSKPR